MENWVQRLEPEFCEHLGIWVQIDIHWGEKKFDERQAWNMWAEMLGVKRANQEGVETMNGHLD